MERYGVTFAEPEPGVDPSPAIELKMAFDERLFVAPGFLGRYEHLHKAIDLIWNEPRRKYAKARGIPYDERKDDAFIFNPWTELMMRSLCENQWTTMTGPNASWKTTSAALYGMCMWLASPQNTAVVLTSTTLDGLRKRIWKEVTRFHRLIGSNVGNVVQSRNCIQFIKGSDDAGVFGVAVDQGGNVEKAVNKIIGFHNTYMLAVVDEMQTTNEAIVKGCVSLEAGAQRFQFIGLGNADSELDPHGQMSEPVNGWDSITPEAETWATKRGICVHLDGLESPRVKEGDEFYPGLLKQSDIESTIRDYGEDSPEFWSKRRGFWAPQGVTKTVLSTAMITKFKAREKAIWATGFKLGAGLDPAYEGGDRCILRIGKCGENSDGKTVMELGEIIPIKVSASSDEPIHYQIARMVKQTCEDKGIGPEMFALDTTGEGGGLASILMREWSRAITQVEFGGAASKRPVSESNPRPANEEYLYRVTELWFWFRTLLQNGQVRGLDNDTAIEFCQRRYEMRGNLRMVEPKSQMKLRTKRSPDLADAAVVLAELFRQRERLLTSGTEVVRQDVDNWRELAKKYDVTSDYALAD